MNLRCASVETPQISMILCSNINFSNVKFVVFICLSMNHRSEGVISKYSSSFLIFCYPSFWWLSRSQFYNFKNSMTSSLSALDILSLSKLYILSFLSITDCHGWTTLALLLNTIASHVLVSMFSIKLEAFTK